MNNIELSQGPLDVASIYSGVVAPDCGAVSLFVGTTRDSFLDKPVLRLEYEAYESMAVKTLHSLADKIRNKFQVRNIAIHHRLGEVPICEASVVIAVSSPHREASLKAVSFAIDSLKANVPIFKKELYADDGTSSWKANSELEEIIEEPKEEMFVDIDPNLVQITASSQEIARRIESFQKRKRVELDQNNIRQFCSRSSNVNADNSSCARVDATFVRQCGSKSHLKVHRVENIEGPQLQNNMSEKMSMEVESGVAERIANAESFLGLARNGSKSQQNIYARLKDIEDRILFLESVSPEYFSNMKQKEVTSNTDSSDFKKTLTGINLERKVLDLEKKFQARLGS